MILGAGLCLHFTADSTRRNIYGVGETPAISTGGTLVRDHNAIEGQALQYHLSEAGPSDRADIKLLNNVAIGNNNGLSYHLNFKIDEQDVVKEGSEEYELINAKTADIFTPDELEGNPVFQWSQYFTTGTYQLRSGCFHNDRFYFKIVDLDNESSLDNKAFYSRVSNMTTLMHTISLDADFRLDLIIPYGDILIVVCHLANSTTRYIYHWDLATMTATLSQTAFTPYIQGVSGTVAPDGKIYLILAKEDGVLGGERNIFVMDDENDSPTLLNDSWVDTYDAKQVGFMGDNKLIILDGSNLLVSNVSITPKTATLFNDSKPWNSFVASPDGGLLATAYHILGGDPETIFTINSSGVETHIQNQDSGEVGDLLVRDEDNVYIAILDTDNYVMRKYEYTGNTEYGTVVTKLSFNKEADGKYILNYSFVGAHSSLTLDDAFVGRWQKLTVREDYFTNSAQIFLNGVLVLEGGLGDFPEYFEISDLRLLKAVPVENASFNITLGSFMVWDTLTASIDGKAVRELKFNEYELIKLAGLQDAIDDSETVRDLTDIWSKPCRVFILDNAYTGAEPTDWASGVAAIDRDFVHLGYSSSDVGQIEVIPVMYDTSWGKMFSGFELQGGFDVLQITTTVINRFTLLSNEETDLIVIPANKADANKMLVLKDVNIAPSIRLGFNGQDAGRLTLNLHRRGSGINSLIKIIKEA